MQNISLYRIKHLLQLQKASSMSWWKTLIIILIASLIMALYLIWLDFDYTLLIYILYPTCTYASFVFLNQDKKKALDYMMLPASTGEKMIALLVYSIVIPTIVVALIIPMIISIQGVINHIAGQEFLAYMPVLEILKPKIFLLGLSIQSLFSFLYLSFKKRTLLYTTFILFIGICVMIFFKMLFPFVFNDIFPYYQAYMHYGELFGNNLLGIISVISNGILICMTILFWIVSYYKLREREI